MEVCIAEESGGYSLKSQIAWFVSRSKVLGHRRVSRFQNICVDLTWRSLRRRGGEKQRLTYNVPLSHKRTEMGRMKPTYLHEFHSNKAESLLLKTLDDLSHKLALDPIRLDGNEGALTVGHGPGERQVEQQ